MKCSYKYSAAKIIRTWFHIFLLIIFFMRHTRKVNYLSDSISSVCGDRKSYMNHSLTAFRHTRLYFVANHSINVSIREHITDCEIIATISKVPKHEEISIYFTCFQITFPSLFVHCYLFKRCPNMSRIIKRRIQPWHLQKWNMCWWIMSKDLAFDIIKNSLCRKKKFFLMVISWYRFFQVVFLNEHCRL